MDDKQLIELFFARSEQAIQALDEKYGKLCQHLSYNILGNRQDAEECVNDAYLGVWNAIPPARPNPLTAFVAKIVRNISLNAYWKKEAAKRKSSCTVALEEIESCLASPATPEAELDAKELARYLEGFLDTLTQENRVIFLRRYWFCDTYQEIGKRVGLPEKTVSVRLTRTRTKLRTYLAEREVFL